VRRTAGRLAPIASDHEEVVMVEDGALVDLGEQNQLSRAVAVGIVEELSLALLVDDAVAAIVGVRADDEMLGRKGSPLEPMPLKIDPARSIESWPRPKSVILSMFPEPSLSVNLKVSAPLAPVSRSLPLPPRS